MKDNTFTTREDLVKEYANKRKGFSEEEVEDLFNCVLGYLKKVTSDNETYAVRIGTIGFMHKKFKPEQKKNRNLNFNNNHTLIDNMIVELCLNNDKKRNPLIRKSIFELQHKKTTVEELEEIQNYVE